MAKRSGSHWREDPRGQKFINPYNFVRIGPKGGVVRVRYSDEDTLSGVISCTLRTRTPLAIPDVEGLPEAQASGKEHKGQGLPKGVPFFRAPKRIAGGGVVEWPSIPGSEIRGVIRSAFEALDDGCLSVNNSNVASARSPFPFLPAILEGRWVPDGRGGHVWDGKLYKATVSKNRTNGSVAREWPIFQHTDKKQAFFFTKGSEIAVTQDELTRAVFDYLEVVRLYKKNSEDHKNGGLDPYLVKEPPRNPGESGTEGAWPLYYDVAGDLAGDFILYLSPAQITRRVFRNRVDDLLGGDGDGTHKRCEDPECACEPCRVFGFVGSKGPLASRVRFTDAEMIADSPEACLANMLGGITLKELSGPKTSAVEFYTKRPVRGREAACTWTYDAATFGYEKANGNDRPQSRRLSVGATMEVLGRKFYLHHHVEGAGDQIDGTILDAASTRQRTKRNMTAELVKSGVEFAFQVFFEGLSEGQIDKLVWAICIGENDIGGKQLHKMGHGKPLGLGSVKITVDHVWYRDFQGQSLFPQLVEKLYEKHQPSCWPHQGIVSDFLAVTDWELTAGDDIRVSYPLADDCKRRDNSQASHQWFKANRLLGEKSVNDMTTWDVYRTLPPLPDAGLGRETHADGAALLLPKYTCDCSRGMSYRKDPSAESKAVLEFADVTKRPSEEPRTYEPPKPVYSTESGENGAAHTGSLVGNKVLLELMAQFQNEQGN